MNINLGNVGNITQPLSKLVEAIRSGTGMVYQPLHKVLMAKADAKALDIADEAAHARQQRAIERLGHQELRRQERIDAVVNEARRMLPESVSATPVDPDWITRFFSDCQDVSDTDLQALWGRILAAEVSAPGTCSRRALTVLRDLSSAEAALFRDFLAYCWSYDGWLYSIIGGSKSLHDYGFKYGDQLTLENHGLISIGDCHWEWNHGDRIDYMSRQHYLLRRGSGKVGGIPVIPLTRAGNEIARVVTPEPREDYYLDCLSTFQYHRAIAVSPWPRHSATSWKWAVPEES
ncbi:MAG TPA: DUF2806 domain-containing protein [Phycisphaerales bacterium]|nr:DUF2806 domain-containing protein [Phycisphaerales bacterium]